MPQSFPQYPFISANVVSLDTNQSPKALHNDATAGKFSAERAVRN